MSKKKETNVGLKMLYVKLKYLKKKRIKRAPFLTKLEDETNHNGCQNITLCGISKYVILVLSMISHPSI